MTLKVEHWDSAREGPLDERALTARLAALGYRVSRYVYPPGTVFPAHSHAVDKIDAVLSGRFRLTLHGETAVLTAGDWIAVPSGEVHSAEVVGNEAVVSLDGVSVG